MLLDKKKGVSLSLYTPRQCCHGNIVWGQWNNLRGSFQSFINGAQGLRNNLIVVIKAVYNNEKL